MLLGEEGSFSSRVLKASLPALWALISLTPSRISTPISLSDIFAMLLLYGNAVQDVKCPEQFETNSWGIVRSTRLHKVSHSTITHPGYSVFRQAIRHGDA